MAVACASGAPAAAAAPDRPPPPLVSSHGARVTAALGSYCDPAGVCDVGGWRPSARSVPYHERSVVTIDTRVPAKSLALEIDCDATLKRQGPRRWTFQVARTATGALFCTRARIEVEYRSGGRYSRALASYGVRLRRHRHACEPGRSRVIAANELVRVYGLMDGGPQDSTENVYACRLDSGRPRRIGENWEAGTHHHFYVGSIALAGDKIAYVTGRRDQWRGAFTFIVRDTATWAISHWYPGGYSYGGNPSHHSITDLALARSGAVAWTEVKTGWTSYGSQYDRRQVIRRDAGGALLVLDEGHTIDLYSLALAGSRLSWTNAGETRSATLG